VILLLGGRSVLIDVGIMLWFLRLVLRFLLWVGGLLAQESM
jgi:hypothetical protein